MASNDNIEQIEGNQEEIEPVQEITILDPEQEELGKMLIIKCLYLFIYLFVKLIN